jgi:RNA polymerase sigma factor (sigma-70 family)
MDDDDCSSNQAVPLDDGSMLEFSSSPSNLKRGNHKDLLNQLRETPSERKTGFTVIYQTYGPDVFNFIQSHGIFGEEAKDIFASVWEEAIKRLPRFNWNEDKPPKTDTPIKTWLFKTVHNKCLEHFRHTEKGQNVILLAETILGSESAGLDDAITEEVILDTASSPIEPAFSKRLQDAISTLKPNEQQIIKLLYIEEKNSPEIGQILGMTPAAVRKAHERLLKKLRILLDPEGVKS